MTLAGWRAAFVAAVAVAMLATTAGPASAAADPSAARPATPAAPTDLRALGEAIYHGQAPLVGRIRRHETPLPTTATRCINCHRAGGPPPPGPAASRFGATQTFGPVLNAEHLTQPRRRRGGPATVYDEQALCTVLREGRDPAAVMLPLTMPLYDATAEQCRALWTYLQTVRAR